MSNETCTTESTLAIWRTDSEFVIARSREDAIAICVEHVGAAFDDCEKDDWRRHPDGKVFTFNEEGDRSCESTEELPAYYIAKYGRCYLGNTEF